jgi:uncharacterized integral membrane protein
MGYILVAIVAVAVAIFAMQNTTAVEVQFIAWKIEMVPVAAVVLASLAAGIIIVGVPLWFKVWRLKSRLRGAQAAAQARDAELPPERPFSPPPDRSSSPYDRPSSPENH